MIRNLEWMKSEKSIKSLAEVVVEELIGEFNPKEWYKENVKVKYWQDPNDQFFKHLLEPSKVLFRMSPISFDKYHFSKFIDKKEIIQDFHNSKSCNLMTREEILWSIAFLTAKQSRGEKGPLITNGYPNLIGSLLCADGIVRDVSTCYCREDIEWLNGCSDPEHWFSSKNCYLDFSWLNKK